MVKAKAPARAIPARSQIDGGQIDRLVHHATMITLKGKSYRLRERDESFYIDRPFSAPKKHTRA
jgi:hypothetical protein